MGEVEEATAGYRQVIDILADPKDDLSKKAKARLDSLR